MNTYYATTQDKPTQQQCAGAQDNFLNIQFLSLQGNHHSTCSSKNLLIFQIFDFKILNHHHKIVNSYK
jgi:hypothetical protein